jgi:hypothetical protein
MTSKTYRTAQGKIVDLGQLILQNENVRAVGNMNVNARGDRLDSSNKVIDPKNKQIQRQNQKQIASNVSDQVVHTSNISAKRAKKVAQDSITDEQIETNIPSMNDAPVDPAPVINEVPVAPPAVEDVPDSKPDSIQLKGGGLAAAIARSRTVVQEKEKTPREIKQFKPGVNRI